MALPLYDIPEFAAASRGSFWQKRLVGISFGTWFMFLLVMSIGVSLYGFTLGFPFQFDDQTYIVSNPLIREPKTFLQIFNVPQLFRTVEERGIPADVATNFVLRPVSYLSFAVNFAIGGVDPRGYRMVNILIHCANTLLLHRLLLFLLSTSPKRHGLAPSSAGFIAVASALLFLVHPMQVEAVTYIVQRFAALGTFFFLLTLLCYFKAAAARDARNQRWWWLGSMAALVVGMFAKEIVFTTPLVLVLLDTLVLGTRLRASLRRAGPHLLCMTILPCVLVVIAMVRGDGHATLMDALSVACPAPARTGAYQFCYALTEVRVVVDYLRLLLVPNRLNVDWDVPGSTSVGDWRVLVSAFAILAIVVWACLFYRRKPNDVRHGLILACVGWYFITLAVSSSLVPLPDFMAEHRAYLASIGALAVVVCLADLVRTAFFRSTIPARSIPLGLTIWIVTLGMSTVTRNEVWRSCTSLWTDTAAKSPNKCRAWGNLGVAYLQEKRSSESVVCLVRAIELRPDYADGYRNLSGALLLMKKYPEALRVGLDGLRNGADSDGLHYNMAQAFWATGKPDEAISALRDALARSPKHFLAHLCLAQFYAEQDKLEPAKEHYQIAASLHPRDQRLYATLVEIRSKERQTTIGAY